MSKGSRNRSLSQKFVKNYEGINWKKPTNKLEKKSTNNKKQNDK